jgi:hypothetical protein
LVLACAGADSRCASVLSLYVVYDPPMLRTTRIGNPSWPFLWYSHLKQNSHLWFTAPLFGCSMYHFVYTVPGFKNSLYPFGHNNVDSLIIKHIAAPPKLCAEESLSTRVRKCMFWYNWQVWSTGGMLLWTLVISFMLTTLITFSGDTNSVLPPVFCSILLLTALFVLQWFLCSSPLSYF